MSSLPADARSVADRPNRRGEVAAALAFAAFAGVATIRAGLRGDLRVHLRFAENYALTGASGDPYPLFSQLTSVLRTFIPWDVLSLIAPGWPARRDTWTIAGVAVAVGATAATFHLVRRRLEAPGPGRLPASPATALAACALLLGPIALPTLAQQGLFDGYVTANAFDNGTGLLLRPLALLVFVGLIGGWGGGDRRRTGALAIASIACLLAKPSLTICLLPAVAIVAALDLRRGRSVGVRHLALGFVVPSVVVLALQLGVSLDQGLGSLEVDPFGTVGTILEGLDLPLAAWPLLLALSCAFPLAVLATGGRRALASRGLRLAWASLAFGIAYFALVRVVGRPDYGEFVGGPQIALLLLHVESVRAAWGDGTLGPGRPSARRVVVRSMFALQLAFGLGFWLAEVVEPIRWH
jgi:hypothetical protein